MLGLMVFGSGLFYGYERCWFVVLFNCDWLGYDW